MRLNTLTSAAAFAMAVLMGTLPMAATAGEEDLRPPLVVDATGKVVGRLVGENTVLMTLTGQKRAYLTLIGIGARSTALQWRGDSGVYFLFRSQDCTGEAFVTSMNGVGTLTTYLDTTNGGAQLYIAHDLDAEKKLGDWHSYRFNGTCTTQDFRSPWVWSLDPPIDLNALYTLPLHVK